MSDEKGWETYEEVSVYLLGQIADYWGLEAVEGKQKVSGNRSGTTWTIDGKGVKSGDEGFVIIECRRYTTRKQNQEQLGGLAYRILDTGAQGGILVSPLGFQEGADKVAAAEHVEDVRLDENSTRTDYILGFLNRVFVGVSDSAGLTDDEVVEIIRGPEADET